MFSIQAKVQGTSINFKSVSVDVFDQIDSDSKITDLYEEALPDLLSGDNIRLQQILINLTKNALKFCLKGTVNILMTYDECDQMLKVMVIDDGRGIKAEDIG